MPASDKPRHKYRMGGQAANVELKLPSINPETGENNVCLARRLGATGLIKLRILDSLDSLTSLVQAGIGEMDGKATPDGVKALAENAEKLEDAIAMIDKIVMASVVEPRVLPVPTVDERDPDELYIDDVDLDDKMFIMNWCVGGSSDLHDFRTATAGLMGAVADGQDVPVEAQ